MRENRMKKNQIPRPSIGELSHQYPGDVIGLSALGLGLRLDSLETPRMLARFCTL